MTNEEIDQLGTEEEGHYHNWQSSSWGVIFGVSKCQICNIVATKKILNEWSEKAVGKGGEDNG